LTKIKRNRLTLLVFIVLPILSFTHTLPSFAFVLKENHLIFAANSVGVQSEENDFGSDEDFDAFDEEFGSIIDSEVFDPLSGYNRGVTRFNDKFYDWILYPVASGYNYVVPKPGRSAIKRFFKNLFFPMRFVNNILQLKYDKAVIETVRFTLNTTIGVAGFFDPAKAWLDLDPYPEDFGQTLGFYGVGSGFPIVLPFVGPSNLRDFIGLFPDAYSVPIPFFY